MYVPYSLSFADSAWHVFAAVFIFLLGAYIALVQYRLFRVPQRLALGMYLWHTIFSLYYLIYSQSNTADAVGYFVESHHFSGLPTPGTLAVTYLTTLFTQGLNMSYGGVFLVFNIFGFIGMLALASVVLELTHGTDWKVRLLVLGIMLLPGLSFWSAAIGKDSLTFLGAGLACWATMDIIKRFPAIILAVAVIFVARPHMAAIMLIALSSAIIIAGRVSITTRVMVILATIPIAAYAVIYAQAFVGLYGDVNIDAIASYVEKRQGYNTEGGLAVDIANMSFSVRMLSYLYRPLFIDGGGFLGLVISAESLILLLLTATAVYTWFKRRKSKLQSFTWWFMLIYVVASWLALANTTANLGIAMRQKWMFLPMILVLCFSYISRPTHTNKRPPN